MPGKVMLLPLGLDRSPLGVDRMPLGVDRMPLGLQGPPLELDRSLDRMPLEPGTMSSSSSSSSAGGRSRMSMEARESSGCGDGRSEVIDGEGLLLKEGCKKGIRRTFSGSSSRSESGGIGDTVMRVSCSKVSPARCSVIEKAMEGGGPFEEENERIEREEAMESLEVVSFGLVGS